MGNTKGTRRKSRCSKWIVMLITGAMLLSPGYGFASVVKADGENGKSAASMAASQLTKTGEEIITSGARLIHYQFTTTRGGKPATAKLNIIEADLSNPYLKLDTMTGKSGQLTTRQSVSGMVKDTGAVAGVNGDYYNTGLEGVPLGGAIAGGAMVSSPSALKGMYAFAVTKEGKPSIDEYRFEGYVQGEDSSTFPLAGINKATYMTEPDKKYSHMDTMYIYTSAWKNQERPSKSSTTPTEVLVRNGVVERLSEMSSLPMTAPEDGYILRGHGKAAEYMRQNMQVGMLVSAKYHLNSQTTGQQVDPGQFQMMIGGHTLLVENGKASGFTRNTDSISGSSARARTAVGYSKDGRYAYIITVEKNDSSVGLTLAEMQKALVQANVWKAVNLDGGGSTTMVHRPLAETSTILSHDTETGSTQRAIVNGLGIFTTAPKGEVKGMMLAGSEKLFIGQEASYTMKAYDQYYNPIDASNTNVNWSSSNSVLVWNGTSFVAKKSGKAQVVAKSGSAKTTKDVEVIGASSLDELYIAASGAPLVAGTAVTLPVKAKLKDGTTVNVPKASVTWELQGFSGNVKDGVLHVTKVPEGSQIGYAFANYDGFKTMIPVTVGAEKLIEDFNKTALTPSFAGLPKESTFGTASIVGNYEGRSAADKVVKLTYDMSKGAANKFAYAILNGGAGLPLGGTPTSMKIDVYGDNSMNWLRAKFTDKNGKEYLHDVSKYIDWSGWKTINVDMSSIGASGDLTLERLYVVNLQDGQDERAAVGEIAFDNIRAHMPAGSSISLPSADMKLTVNSKTASVNGKDKKLDVAPIVLHNSTYVPVKVILDEFGGKSTWNSAARKVTVLRGDRYIELVVGAKEFISNGKRNKSEVAPVLRSNRTLVPLRLVSEQLGLVINWDIKSKSITIR